MNLDKLKTIPVEQCNFEQRSIIAKNLAEEINKFISRTNPIYSSELNENGFIQLKYISENKIKEIIANLRTKLVYNSHVPYGDGIKRNLGEAKKFSFGCYELADVISCPHLLEIVLNEEVLGLAEDYLGCVPTLYSMNTWWSFPRGIANTQSYHRDYDDYRFLALFIYLTDVTTENGAHCFIKGSHKKDEFITENPEIFVSKAGTCFLADTYGIHKSLPLVSGERLVFWARYGLAENGPYKAQIKEPVKIDIKLNEKLKYITRLIIKAG